MENYNPNPIFPMCRNCRNYKADLIPKQPYKGKKFKVLNVRCSISDLPVKKGGTCLNHSTNK